MRTITVASLGSGGTTEEDHRYIKYELTYSGLVPSASEIAASIISTYESLSTTPEKGDYLYHEEPEGLDYVIGHSQDIVENDIPAAGVRRITIVIDGNRYLAYSVGRASMI